MLTLKVITENPEEVIRKLSKKRFDAKAPIEDVLSLDKVRRSSQTSLDSTLSEINTLSKSVGQLMKDGKKDEAEAVKLKVSSLKESTSITSLLLSITSFLVETIILSYSLNILDNALSAENL